MRKCPFNKCDGSGVIASIDENGCTMATFCKCREQIIKKSKIKFADIPAEFKDLTINSFRTDWYKTTEGKQKAIMAKKASVNFVKCYEDMKKKGKGLYLYSYAKGSGKTRMAASIGNALVNALGVSVKFTTTTGLFDEIKATFDKGREYTQSQLLDDIKRIETLILDDIGTEKPSTWVNEVLYGILNDRMTAKKVTIFTSNCSVEELKHDDRIKNRIEKMTVPIPFPDESIRSYIAKSENENLQNMLFE